MAPDERSHPTDQTEQGRVRHPYPPARLHGKDALAKRQRESVDGTLLEFPLLRLR